MLLKFSSLNKLSTYTWFYIVKIKIFSFNKLNFSLAKSLKILKRLPKGRSKFFCNFEFEKIYLEFNFFQVSLIFAKILLNNWNI